MQPIRLTDSGPSGTLFDRKYGYNGANQISQITEPSQTRIFGYDNADRLTGVTGSVTEGYLFDDVGNRTSSHRSNSYGYQPFSKIASTQTATYGSDANGNMTTKGEGSNFWRYTWDYENRMYSASTRKQTVKYSYDALGRRVKRHIPGGKEITKFVYDGNDVLVDDNFGTLTKYLNGSGIDNKLRQTTGSTASYFLADHLGSTNGLTNSTGSLTASNSYDSFGNPTNLSFSSRYQFTGREFDSFTGLQFSRARFYDPNLGSFISEDPIGFEASDINLYGYVRNNPVAKIDPFGEDEIMKIDRLQHYVDPETRPYVKKWNDCLSRCLATHIAVQAAGFTGFTFGQPMSPKRFVTPGSSPATSPISEGLSGMFPQQLKKAVWAPTYQNPLASSNKLGRVLGRWTPIVSAGMMIVDFELIRSCTNSCYRGECGM